MDSQLVKHELPNNIDAICKVGRWAWECAMPWGQVNSIAFGSAPRREAVSQLDRPAVSQTETHTLGFLSVADTDPSSGENTCS